MDVTCETCGIVGQVQDPVADGDPEQDGWLYVTETDEYTVDVDAPSGDTVTTTVPYQKKVARQIIWVCDNGHTSTYTEELD